MKKFKYHLPGHSKKKMKEVQKKPIPTILMVSPELKAIANQIIAHDIFEDCKLWPTKNPKK